MCELYLYLFIVSWHNVLFCSQFSRHFVCCLFIDCVLVSLGACVPLQAKAGFTMGICALPLF